MYKHRIELVTSTDIVEFIKSVADANGYVKLVDGNGFCVNGKSLLGALAAVEWNSLYCVSENDIYQRISKFCTEEE